MRHIYRVKKNETIEDIAKIYNIDPQFIRSVNKIDQTHEGQILTIYTIQGKRYIVKPHDTFESIAEQFKVTPEYIKKNNGVENLFIGQILYIEYNKTQRKDI